jgi:CBS domain containing-hemolysin-like protein
MPELLFIAGSILMAGFFAGSETGTYSLNRLRLRLLAEQGRPSARVLLAFIRKPRLAISTTLIGTNIGHYVATVLCTQKLAALLSSGRAELYSGLIMPPILLVLAEIIPKSLFQHHADVLLYRTIWPLRGAQALFYPVAMVLRWFGGLPGLLLGGKRQAQRAAFTAESFRFYLSEGAADGAMSSFQRTMAENIMHLKALDVADAMTELERVVMVSEEAGDEELLTTFRTHRYSRLPVYRGERDRIVGVINVIDLASADQLPARAADLAHGVLRIRPGTSVADALRILRNARQQFAVVTDEDGCALGISTVKDLVEEIVGELEAW